MTFIGGLNQFQAIANQIKPHTYRTVTRIGKVTKNEMHHDVESQSFLGVI